MKKINIGILGFGTVGSGTYDILTNNKEIIEKRTGCSYEIKKILVRSPERLETHGVPSNLGTSSVSDIIENDEIHIVVESIGGIEPATEWMLTALKNGKSVVTPNKAAVAANFHRLKAAAKEGNAEIRIEACVGGGIPALTAITEALSGNNFSEVLGIVNGTTNYILTKMGDEGLSYDEVLKDAQAKGFAEADPTADVEGIDCANKLSILMSLAFDKYVAPDDIPTQGITRISMEDLALSKKRNCKIKLISRATLNEDGNLSYEVKPMELPLTHPLSGVNNEFNAIYVTGDAVGEVMFYGKGAGALPTGSAVVGDIIAIMKRLNK